jgi:hypothetical protein
MPPASSASSAALSASSRRRRASVSGSGGSAASAAAASAAAAAAASSAASAAPALPKKLSLAAEIESAAFITKGDPEKIFADLRKLGEGASGQVFLGTDRRCGEQVAIKVAPATELAALKQEIALQKMCAHPCVVGYKETFLTKDAGHIWVRGAARSRAILVRPRIAAAAAAGRARAHAALCPFRRRSAWSLCTAAR